MRSTAWKFSTALAVWPDAHWPCALRNHVKSRLKSSRSSRPTCALRSASALNHGAKRWPTSTHAADCEGLVAADERSAGAVVAENTAPASTRTARSALRLCQFPSLRPSRSAQRVTASSWDERSEPDGAGEENGLV